MADSNRGVPFTQTRISLDNLELRLLSYFNAVAEFGSISRAAATLHMTQPTLSRQLRQLESMVGHALFVRTTRGTKLTAAGEGLRTHTALIAAQVSRIPEVLFESSHKRQVVSMGLPSGMPDEWFLAFRAELQHRAPHVALSLHDMNTREQRIMIANKSLDIGLIHAEPQELPSRWMFRQSLGFAVRDTHSAQSKSSFSFSDMDGATILAQSTSSERTRLETQSLEHGVSIDWRFRTFATHSLFIADSAGADAVLLTQATAARNFPGWVWLPILAQDKALYLHSWAAWGDDAAPTLSIVLDAMSAAARSSTHVEVFDGTGTSDFESRPDATE